MQFCCDGLGDCDEQCNCRPGGCHGCDCTRQRVELPGDKPPGFRSPMGNDYADPLDLSGPLAPPPPGSRGIRRKQPRATHSRPAGPVAMRLRGRPFWLTPSRQMTRLSLRSGSRISQRVGLGGVEEYAGRACLDVRNDKGRPASDPCAYYCGATDVGSWSRLCEKLIGQGRASCHRIGKCQRVEELAAKYQADTSTTGQIGFITSGNLIRSSLIPIAQELACLVTDAAAAGQHPDAPRPLPAPPPVGPGPSERPPLFPGWPTFAGAGIGLALLAVVAFVALARK